MTMKILESRKLTGRTGIYTSGMWAAGAAMSRMNSSGGWMAEPVIE